jgi:DNA-binding NarL/FixJ family response regulator
MDTPHLIRIVAADDHRLFLDGLQRLLAEAPGLRLVAAAANGAETLDAVRRERPDVLLLDIDMPAPDGFAVADTLRAERFPVRIILLTMHDETPYQLAASRPDIQGFVLKDAAFEELVAPSAGSPPAGATSALPSMPIPRPRTRSPRASAKSSPAPDKG